MKSFAAAVAACLLCAGCAVDLRPKADIPSTSRQLATELADEHSGGEGMLAAASLANADRLDATSRFGRLMGERVASELDEKGFDLVDVRTRKSLGVDRSGEFGLSRDRADIAEDIRASAVMAGTYTLAADRVFVEVRLLEPGTGRVLASASDDLPKDGNVRRLLGLRGSPNESVVPGFEERFNDSMCCDLVPDW